ncbi:hypothetical protein Q8G35_03320 [Peribacillus simplex]|uniref:Uncharacterized protein n=2 Tax=Peribacillus TaxID=2675229 RepID=A0AA90SUI1_9BACI|nr:MULTISPECIES: hypothetical protein [Peribacillus]MDP1417435.1 hypothetical protein [Peribacillus simplex]MDP1450090.1 hypothetical protein [Peribacillus frigoritolerans]
MPIFSKVKRIRTHYDKALHDSLYACQLFDIAHGDAKFKAVYPSIAWEDGIPKSELEQAEIMEGSKATIDIKRQSNV